MRLLIAIIALLAILLLTGERDIQEPVMFGDYGHNRLCVWQIENPQNHICVFKYPK